MSQVDRGLLAPHVMLASHVPVQQQQQLVVQQLVQLLQLVVDDRVMMSIATETRPLKSDVSTPPRPSSDSK